MPKPQLGRYPVGGVPAGLISWFAPGKRPVALVTYWMAVIGGETSRVRASWPGRRDPRSLFWAGGDFVLNIPAPAELQLVRALVGRGRLCFDIEQDLGMAVRLASQIAAPCIVPCAVQLECCGGRIDAGPVEPEVSGEVVLLHRGEMTISFDAAPDLAVLRPFSPDMTPE